MKRKSNMTSEEYIHSMHKFGRICCLIAVVIMIAMPLVASLYFDAMPRFSEVLTASAALLAVFVPTALSEVISYTPVLGSSIYLTLITGNVMNLKLPAATNAMELLDCEYGTEKADVVNLIAVCSSTLTTLAIIAVGVLLMIPLQPVLTIPAVKTASNYILPSLFGSLMIRLSSPTLGGGITSPDRLKAAIVPTLFVAIISACDTFIWKLGIMSLYQGIVIIILIPMLYFGTKILYNKGKIHVYLPGESQPKGK